MNEVSNQVFLGCNYNDKKIKAQFDNLKKRIEKSTPLSCIIVNKRKGKPAQDIWKDIKELIENSSVCLFDLTGFRPNVVLELGYALSIKDESQIFITFRKRKANGKTPQWLLSDIGHLNRFEYIQIKDLETHIKEQLRHTKYGANWYKFLEEFQDTNASEKYQQKGLEILQTIRNKGAQSDRQIKQIMAGTACRYERMTKLLRKHKLVSRGKGKHGKYVIPVEDSD